MIYQQVKKSPQCQIPLAPVALGRRGRTYFYPGIAGIGKRPLWRHLPPGVPRAVRDSDPNGKKHRLLLTQTNVFTSQKSGGGNGSVEKAESLEGGTEKLPGRPKKALKQQHYLLEGYSALLLPQPWPQLSTHNSCPAERSSQSCCQGREGRKGPGTWKKLGDAAYLSVNEAPKSSQREKVRWMECMKKNSRSRGREQSAWRMRTHPSLLIYPFHKASPYYSWLLTKCKLL